MKGRFTIAENLPRVKTKSHCKRPLFIWWAKWHQGTSGS